jgi:hypothetical protein
MSRKEIKELLIALAIIVIFGVGVVTSLRFLIILMSKVLFWLITTIIMFGR